MVSGGSSDAANTNAEHSRQPLKLKALKFGQVNANIVQADEASNGFVYIIDSVLVQPDDAEYLAQTAPAAGSSMSSLLGGRNSALAEFLHALLSPSPMNLSAHSMLIAIAALTLAISALVIFALVLVVRRRRHNNRHQQLESGLTSSSSANSGSTSTTKSL